MSGRDIISEIEDGVMICIDERPQMLLLITNFRFILSQVYDSEPFACVSSREINFLTTVFRTSSSLVTAYSPAYFL
jgi:hypothetical protein